MSNMQKEQLLQLEAFVEFCRNKPEVLHKPELSFFKHYLESLGAKIPPAPRPESPPKAKETEEVNMEEPSTPEEPEPVIPESEESEVELDNSGVVEADNDDPLPMGDSSVEVTEENMEQSSEKRGQAMEAQSEGKLDESLKLWTEAIELNPTSAVLFAKRANVLLKLEKPNAAIRDANKALELNPDQALGFKIRGRAHRLLGHWEEAAKDLAMACKLDYTDEANEWLKEVTPNAKKLQEHRRKWERKREERELKERAERVRKAREEQERKYKAQQQQQQQDEDDMGGFPGFPGSMPGGLGDCLQDPEILAAFQDPEVAAAFQDISRNPMNIGKYQSNPKIKNIMTKMAMKMGGQAPPM
uniref:Putative heat shock 70kd protein n=1 Tax=Amblyomma aureolatum TaxID=187763 RepID=A0A1E1XF55_9ACAR